MAETGAGVSGFRDSPLEQRSAEEHARIAWILLLGGFTVLLLLLAGAILGVRWYLSTATTAQTATMQVVSGTGLLVRSPGQADWRLVTDTTELHEGDTISTGPGSAGWVTLFDGGTVEVSEDSGVTLRRMRTSRFWQDRKEFLIEPLWGTVYVGMAAHGEFAQSSLEVVAGPARVSMVDSPRTNDAGSFLVEVHRTERDAGPEEPILMVRVGVLRGVATVETENGTRILSADEQTIVSANGAFGPVTAAVREMIRNGDFARHMADWVEYHELEPDGQGAYGTVHRVPVELNGQSQVAAEFWRGSEHTDHAETGLQQKIGYTLRVYSSLRLAADVWIDAQQPPGGGAEHTEYPLILKLTYVDLQGQPREWWHGFYIQPGPKPEPHDRATWIPRGTWQHVEFDLRHLTPLPRQISSILVYSSGHSYKTRVTNLSLTSNEAGDHE